MLKSRFYPNIVASYKEGSFVKKVVSSLRCLHCKEFKNSHSEDHCDRYNHWQYSGDSGYDRTRF